MYHTAVFCDLLGDAMNIIEMAEEAGLAFSFDDHPDIWATYTNTGRKEIECFVALVEAAARADEREACAKLFDNQNIWDEEVAIAIRARGTT